MSAKKKELNTDAMVNEFTSESAFFQPASTQVHKTTSVQVDKTASPLVVKYTTHLPPSIIDEIKTFAFTHKVKDYQVVQVALSEFLEWHKDQDLVVEITYLAMQSNLSVNDVIVQALREFREKHT
jgi:hypothetical protein